MAAMAANRLLPKLPKAGQMLHHLVDTVLQRSGMPYKLRSHPKNVSADSDTLTLANPATHHRCGSCSKDNILHDGMWSALDITFA
jgi:hypothetical protein